MIEKRIHLDLDPENTFVLDPTTQVGLSKTASVSDSMQSEIQKILKNPDPKYTYLLVNALGAGEYWGPNSWGDYFSEKDLINSFKTFFTAHVFRQHKNFNPKLSIGDVLYAEYNPDMHRVELIIRVQKDKAPDVVADIEKGKLPDVSMGCKVKYDVCSICGNKAPTRLQYCDHAKNHMNEILPDGRKVFVYNPNPKFFDISIVRKGADRTAKTLKKIASDSGDPEAKVAEHKKAEITKEVPAQEVIPLQDYFNSLADPTSPRAQEFIQVLHIYVQNQPDITTALLAANKRVPWQDILQALEELQIPVTAKELDAIVPDELLNLPEELRPSAMQPTPDYYPGKYASMFAPLMTRSVNPLFMEFVAKPSVGIAKEAAMSGMELAKLKAYLTKILSSPMTAIAHLLWILILAMLHQQPQDQFTERVNQALASTPGTSYIDQLMAVSRAVQQGAPVPVGVHADAVGMKLSSADVSLEDYMKLAGRAIEKLAAENSIPEEFVHIQPLPLHTGEIKTAGLIGSAFKWVGMPVLGYSLASLPSHLAKRDIQVKKYYNMQPGKMEKFISNTGPLLGTVGAMAALKPGRTLIRKGFGLTKALFHH